MKDLFCNSCSLTGAVPELIAREVLGMEQLYRILFRDQQLRGNYALTYAEWQQVFTEDLKPFRGYSDTTSVTMPVTHPLFGADIAALGKGAIGVDLPTWFNLKDNDRRVMIVAQDPLRGNTWYSDVDKFPKGKTGRKEDYICVDALVSSPFGLHGRGWRENKRGGGRMALLVEKLIKYGYGVYLTDCRKYFVYDASESAEYSKGKKEIYKAILHKEIDIVNPKSIVTLGNQAYSYCHELIGNDARLLYVPHFSGAATWKAKDFFNIPGTQKVSIEELSEKYAEYIIRECK